MVLKVVTYVKTNNGLSKYLIGLEDSKHKRIIYRYISLNTFEKNEYKIPKDFVKEPMKKSQQLYFYNPKLKELDKNNDKYRKIKSEMKGYKHYFIHDNGGRPFLVYVNKTLTSVRIYKTSKDYYVKYDIEDDILIWSFIELVKEYKKIVKVFIGESPYNSVTSFSGGSGAEFKGNSILLQLSKQMYVYIGSEIYKFRSRDQIKQFISPVGNNDVPYPYALGTNFCYFFIYATKIAFSPFMKSDEFNDHAYSYYYNQLKFPSEEVPTKIEMKIDYISKII